MCPGRGKLSQASAVRAVGDWMVNETRAHTQVRPLLLRIDCDAGTIRCPPHTYTAEPIKTCHARSSKSPTRCSPPLPWAQIKIPFARHAKMNRRRRRARSHTQSESDGVGVQPLVQNGMGRHGGKCFFCVRTFSRYYSQSFVQLTHTLNKPRSSQTQCACECRDSSGSASCRVRASNQRASGKKRESLTSRTTLLCRRLFEFHMSERARKESRVLAWLRSVSAISQLSLLVFMTHISHVSVCERLFVGSIIPPSIRMGLKKYRVFFS
jgi:hypothetical protein